MVVAPARQSVEAEEMVGWRDERVRAAEEVLRLTERTADDVLESAAPDGPPPPPPEPEEPVLRDAW